MGNVSVRRGPSERPSASRRRSCRSRTPRRPPPQRPHRPWSSSSRPLENPPATSLSLGRALAPGRSRAPRSRRARSRLAAAKAAPERPLAFALRRLSAACRTRSIPHWSQAREMPSNQSLRLRPSVLRMSYRSRTAEAYGPRTGAARPGPVQGHTRLRFALPRGRCIEPSPWPPTSSLSKSPSSSSSPA